MPLLLSKDAWLLLLAAGALVLESLLLMHDMKVVRLSWLGETGKGRGVLIGHVVERQRVLRGRSEGSLSWNRLGPGDGLRADDTVMTGKLSTARLRLGADGDLELEPETLLRFSDLKDARKDAPLALEIDRGMVRVLVQKRPLTVRLRRREVVVRPDTALTYTREPLASRAELKVERGEVRVGAGPDGVVRAGETIEINRDGDLSVKRASLPEAPRPAIVPKVAPRVPEKLRAPRPKGARVLPRQSSVDAPSEGRLHRAWAFTRGAWERVARFLLPEALAAEGWLLLEFAWEPARAASGYHLEVSAEKDFRRILKTLDVIETTVTVELPARKVYYWRVAASDEDGDLGPYSPVQTLEPDRAALGTGGGSRAARQSFLQRKRGAGSSRFGGVKIGVGTGFLSQGTTAPDFNVGGQGFPVSLEGALHWRLLSGELEFRFFHLRARYQSRNGAFDDFQPNLDQSLFGGQVLRRHAFFLGGIPLSLGLRVQNQRELVRTGPETVEPRSLPYFAILAGPGFAFPSGRQYLKMELLMEAAPVGQVRGVGLMARGVWGFRKLLGPFTPELELVVHPAWRFVSPRETKIFSVGVTGMLMLGWLFDPVPVAAPRARGG